MFKKNEMFKTAILAALVVFSTVAVFGIVVMVPNGGSMTQAHAFMIADPSGKHVGHSSGDGAGYNANSAGVECDCPGIA